MNSSSALGTVAYCSKILKPIRCTSNPSIADICQLHIMPDKLAGKVAIITGAGGGYGEGIAKKFTEEGAKVVLIDIVGNNIARVAAALPSGTAVGIQGDVSKETSWQAALDEAIKHFGKVDIVVNNAGIVNGARVRDIWNPRRLMYLAYTA